MPKNAPREAAIKRQFDKLDEAIAEIEAAYEVPHQPSLSWIRTSTHSFETEPRKGEAAQTAVRAPAPSRAAGRSAWKRS